ncbi:MAG: endonuclease V [Candidatus Hadarchaeum sp.]|uniref:endonuclease V n=1 Tax=Candidatus Hadarchaeum sp. TaxID=2883567 RepID=UPI003D0C8A79
MLPLLTPPKLDLKELAKVQERVAERVVQSDGFSKLEKIAGCDISFAQSDRAFAAAVVLSYPALEVLDQRAIKLKLKFPYLPTFLAFRELEGMLKVLHGIEADVYMVGAQGVAHPRRAGLASHLGVILDRPTLGVAKSKLCGGAEEPGKMRGSFSLLKEDGETIGAVVRTRDRGRPVYVSVGHKISLPTAIKITLETTREHRLPEPLRLAHVIATRAMQTK